MYLSGSISMGRKQNKSPVSTRPIVLIIREDSDE